MKHDALDFRNRSIFYSLQFDFYRAFNNRNRYVIKMEIPVIKEQTRGKRYKEKLPETTRGFKMDAGEIIVRLEE